MPHFPKPFFRPSRGLWYLQVEGKQVNLGPEREAAFALYHTIMGQPRPVVARADAVVVLLDLFLEWTRNNRSSGSYGWYLEHLAPFARSLPDGLTVAAIRPFHVQQYLDAKTTWSSSTKRGAVIAIKRAFNWVEKMGHIDRNPLRHVEKPEAGRREQINSRQEHERILSLTKDQEFRDLLTAAWETGAPPQELFRVEARHVDLKNGRWVFPKDESKGKRHSWMVYLNDTMLDLTRRLMLKRPEGPLFRNASYRPWNALALNNRFIYLRAGMGRRAMREQGIDVDEAEVIFADTDRSATAADPMTTDPPGFNQAVDGAQRHLETFGQFPGFE